jgi:hypothetical protein
MIVFDLECVGAGHRFEGWFGSSDDFAAQQARGLVACPHCGDAQVIKAPMAPRLGRKGNQIAAVAQEAPQKAMTQMPPEAQAKLAAAFKAVAQAQAEALKSSRWVGKDFVKDARAMHYGDAEPAPIHGQASPEEAKALAEEGVPVAPILFPVAPPEELN